MRFNCSTEYGRLLCHNHTKMYEILEVLEDKIKLKVESANEYNFDKHIENDLVNFASEIKQTYFKIINQRDESFSEEEPLTFNIENETRWFLKEVSEILKENKDFEDTIRRIINLGDYLIDYIGMSLKEDQERINKKKNKGMREAI